MTDYAVVNPADNQKVREFEAHTDDQIRQMLDRAHAAQQAPHRRAVPTDQLAELAAAAAGRKPGQLDPESVRTGCAVQAGGPQLRVIVDSVPHKRPVTRVTFYRHLRDLQIVRP